MEGLPEPDFYPASILYKSTAGRYRPVSYPDGPIRARCRFIKNAYWVLCYQCLWSDSSWSCLCVYMCVCPVCACVCVCPVCVCVFVCVFFFFFFFFCILASDRY